MNQQQVYEEIIQGLKQLPLDKVLEVLDFVEFLNTQHKQLSKLTQKQNKKIVQLKGLWKGFEPTDEEIQQARKEIWKHLDTKEIL
jgi:hypothetical protein